MQAFRKANRMLLCGALPKLLGTSAPRHLVRQPFRMHSGNFQFEWKDKIGENHSIALSDRQINHLYKTFKAIDVNGNGLLEKSEVAQILARTGHDSSTEAVNRLFANASEEANAKGMEFVEFVELSDHFQPLLVHDMVHFKTSPNAHPTVDKLSGKKETWENPMQHSVWTEDQINGVAKTHKEPECQADRLAFNAVRLARFSFDTLSLFNFGELTKSKVLKRAIFLETVAGVPGMCAAMIRHLRSLRRMDRDHGWIHTLLEEAENERMHLLTFVKMYQPGPMFRLAVLGAQGIFMNLFFLTYLVNPKICHRFVGYLEEEAVKTYTMIVDAIDDGRLKEWAEEPAPNIAIHYWHLRPDATVRDLMLVVRMDEATHRDVNHGLASIDADDYNPFLEKH